ncbi:hypothetical protein [Vibrio metschnikovii]|uniref:Uncharacterized protein n=1 Tax=Vibrio metschnikovii TaxID=28172 RepID=A0A9X0UJ24_VIBME|nr:hypothetical protein [Vibrio metschnikovii]MBC5853037.1 hypothetical protein [Vibrio metschnikovii]
MKAIDNLKELLLKNKESKKSSELFESDNFDDDDELSVLDDSDDLGEFGEFNDDESIVDDEYSDNDNDDYESDSDSDIDAILSNFSHDASLSSEDDSKYKELDSFISELENDSNKETGTKRAGYDTIKSVMDSIDSINMKYHNYHQERLMSRQIDSSSTEELKSKSFTERIIIPKKENLTNIHSEYDGLDLLGSLDSIIRRVKDLRVLAIQSKNLGKEDSLEMKELSLWVKEIESVTQGNPKQSDVSQRGIRASLVLQNDLLTKQNQIYYQEIKDLSDKYNNILKENTVAKIANIANYSACNQLMGFADRIFEIDKDRYLPMEELVKNSKARIPHELKGSCSKTIELAKMSRNEILGISGVGSATFKNIKSAFSDNGLFAYCLIEDVIEYHGLKLNGSNNLLYRGNNESSFMWMLPRLYFTNEAVIRYCDLYDMSFIDIKKNKRLDEDDNNGVIEALSNLAIQIKTNKFNDMQDNRIEIEKLNYMLSKNK